MRVSIIEAVARIKRNVAACLSESAIEAACAAVAYAWRERELGPVETVWTFLTQGGN